MGKDVPLATDDGPQEELCPSSSSEIFKIFLLDMAYGAL